MPRWWRAQAKLNLYLHVVGRRSDGYHLLDSLVAFADLGDEIAAAPSARLSLKIEGRFASKLDANRESNLVWRAAQMLAQRLGRKPDAALTLKKNLPVAAGIGGGSSDAAATLNALSDLWGGEVNGQLLAEVGLSLGADVPACLAARPCWVGGIGEEVELAPGLPAAFLVLANPGVPLPTAAVFRAYRAPFSAPARFAAMPASLAEFVDLLAARRNDLTAAAIAQVPAIAALIERLASAEGALLSRMSGSGATCFALFATAREARAAAAAIRAEQPDWWVAEGGLSTP